jgi:hypothetical protein
MKVWEIEKRKTDSRISNKFLSSSFSPSSLDFTAVENAIKNEFFNRIVNVLLLLL